jgi:hypothetical protein
VGGNSIVLASSYDNSVTLHHVSLAVGTPVSTHKYIFNNTPDDKYFVQDIGMFPINDAVNPRFSVVGFSEKEFTLKAWHGHVYGLSSNVMTNNIYFSTGTVFQHYKIKVLPGQDDFTGGYYQGGWQRCALSGAPLTVAPNCDWIDESLPPDNNEIMFVATFGLTPNLITIREPDTFAEREPNIPYYYVCTPFKGGAPAPEMIMAPEKESEITTFYDRITVKNTPANTNYQIFSIQGQLMQTGNTTSDISTAQLSRGIYILRLENGKAFKFVK